MPRKKGQRQGKDISKYKNSAVFVKKKCVIGIDQSYTRTGLTISVDNQIKKITSISFKYIKTKSGKRMKLFDFVSKAVKTCVEKYGKDNVVVIFERIRLYSDTTVLSPAYIKAESALCAVIVDAAYQFEVEAWSVDTRSWKSRILGSSKPLAITFNGVKDPQKIAAVKFIISKGFEESISCKKGRGTFVSYNDDAADSACISLYGFINEPALKREL